MKYLMMESKLCILEENYSRAEEHAGKALNKGKQYKFQLEIGPAQEIRSIVYVSPVYHKLSYRLKILPVGTPAILPPRRIRIRGRPDLTNLHNAFHTIKIVTSWTSRTLNKQIWVVHSPILPRVSLTQSLAFSAIQKGKGTKKVHTYNCLSKIIFAMGTLPYGKIILKMFYLWPL